MGAWGTGIFADDVACDIRAGYRELLAEGLTGPQATRRLLRDWKQAVEDADDGPIIWLALAATQWQAGQLEERVKKNALRVIDKGLDLCRWESEGKPAFVRSRRKALETLRARLESPPPARKKVRVRKKREPYRDPQPWAEGQVVAYRLLSGNWILMQVEEVEEPFNAPAFAIFDWKGKKIPTAAEIKKLKLKRRDENAAFVRVYRYNDKELPVERLQFLPVKRPTNNLVIRVGRTGRSYVGGLSLANWKKAFDLWLEYNLKWK